MLEFLFAARHEAHEATNDVFWCALHDLLREDVFAHDDGEQVVAGDGAGKLDEAGNEGVLDEFEDHHGHFCCKADQFAYGLAEEVVYLGEGINGVQQVGDGEGTPHGGEAIAQAGDDAGDTQDGAVHPVGGFLQRARFFHLCQLGFSLGVQADEAAQDVHAIALYGFACDGVFAQCDPDEGVPGGLVTHPLQQGIDGNLFDDLQQFACYVAGKGDHPAHVGTEDVDAPLQGGTGTGDVRHGEATEEVAKVSEDVSYAEVEQEHLLIEPGGSFCHATIFFELLFVLGTIGDDVEACIDKVVAVALYVAAGNGVLTDDHSEEAVSGHGCGHVGDLVFDPIDTCAQGVAYPLGSIRDGAADGAQRIVPEATAHLAAAVAADEGASLYSCPLLHGMGKLVGEEVVTTL